MHLTHRRPSINISYFTPCTKLQFLVMLCQLLVRQGERSYLRSPGYRLIYLSTGQNNFLVASLIMSSFSECYLLPSCLEHSGSHLTFLLLWFPFAEHCANDCVITFTAMLGSPKAPRPLYRAPGVCLPAVSLSFILVFALPSVPLTLWPCCSLNTLYLTWGPFHFSALLMTIASTRSCLVLS